MSASPRLVGVVADDVTGANDIGIMYAKAGYETHVYPYDGSFTPGTSDERPDVIILDTDSRFDTPETAYDKVFHATRDLLQAGCTVFIKKTCSVGRGNVGAEFDAMLDALNEPCAIVVFGFPKNGRTTREGIHYVHGVELDRSEFRNDPMHPMTRSDLKFVLQQQTQRTVAAVTYETVAQGAAALKARIEELKTTSQYLLLDVEDQDSLRTIAEAVKDERVTAGASALSEELALVWGRKERPSAGPVVADRPGLGCVLAAGSLMPQTAAQIAELKRKQEAITFVLNTLLLFSASDREAEISRIADEMQTAVLAGRDVLVHSPNLPESVSRTKEEGELRGLDGKSVSQLVSGAIAEVVARVLAGTGQNRLIVAGGDTSAAVCARLGVRGMRLHKEIQPGLPSCVTLGAGIDPLWLVLKSGSFGKADFLLQALHHIRYSETNSQILEEGEVYLDDRRSTSP
ncbi:four-carbon acid sugar kinase family protein [Paenibacillus gansuensis]|uniref:Four-carbon acid sugar kinase family protein n=1 Tax=Paenibacillus gansuensis TaxID=306542 RepID=A0ABW5P9Y5_9BACL